MNQPWFGVLLIAGGLALFVAVQRDFAALVSASGRLSRWAMVMPSTRVGSTAVALAIALTGVSVIRTSLGQEGGRGAIANLVLALMVGGLLHDVVSWIITAILARRPRL